MNKYVLSFLFLLMAASAMGQKKTSRIELISSEATEYTKGANGKIIGKSRKGVFKQDFSTLTSDSALFYPDLNVVDAYGHVVINQGDTLHIFSDKLHYDGNTKIAILTDNVKMVDKDATLTTNYLTYNTATRIGTYTGGGKLVNKDNTLVSKNGYYFAFSRDAYFRYDVVFNTADAIIKTDTLRYNSGTRISYFYGPTTIVGLKDKDTLYTENGRYETIPEKAYFGKNNLYTQNTKTLKGDSLFYDRLKGYGRAVKHVVFNDSEQKATIRGDLGEYFKATEHAVITEHPYVIFVTEDSTQTDTAGKKPVAPLKSDSAALAKGLIKNMPDAGQLNAIGNVAANKKLTLQGVTDSVMKKLPPVAGKDPSNKQMTLQGITDSVMKKVPANVKGIPPNKKMTLQAITDSVMKKVPANVKGNLPNKKMSLQGITDSVMKKVSGAPEPTKTKPAVKDTGKNKPGDNAGIKKRKGRLDSLYMGADTIESQMMTFKALKTLQTARFLANNRDTSIKIIPVVLYKTSPKVLSVDPPAFPKDTSFIHRYFFGKPKPPVVKVAPKPKPAPVKKISAADSLKAKAKADSIALKAPKPLSDTSRIRVIFGYHNAKLFKTDLQAKSDSMFYSSSDSTIRCYVNPIIWTQGSQLSGDTINLQMKNRKLDNVDLYPSGLIVNIEKNDSLHFNQAGGRMIHGTFKNNKLNSLQITGNAETIYFNRDTVKNIVTEMERSLSNSITATFRNGQLHKAGSYGKPESVTKAIDKVKEDDKILKAFIWKPKERPLSKESIIGTPGAKPAATKTGAAKGVPAKKPAQTSPAVKKPGDIKAATDTLAKPPVKLLKDSVMQDSSAVKIKPAVKDTTVKKN